MIPWELIGRADVPDGGGELRLYKHGRDFSIRVDGYELMNSRVHGSEEVLAAMACEMVEGRPKPRILIGGLGMGFTAAAALHRMPEDSEIVVAEIVPAVVEWNRGPLSDLAGRPLEDPRIVVREVDIARILQDENQAYDAILLDVDNGPDGLTRQGNSWLYSGAGLQAAYETLRPAGVLAVWSAGQDQAFTQRLKRAGFKVTENRVRARAGRKGGHHTIWLGIRGR